MSIGEIALILAAVTILLWILGKIGQGIAALLRATREGYREAKNNDG